MFTMKPNVLFLVLIFTTNFVFGQVNAQTFELMPNSKDTINFIDIDGRKQGKWVLFGKHKQNSCYAPTQKAEEGSFNQNRKIGIWMEYFCNGNPKNKVTFANGRPDGYVIIYHENGKIEQEGQWKNNRWIGTFKRYYANGELQHQFKFNESGKREGEQIYKYENGQTAVIGNFVNGKEIGVIKEFYENGDLKAEKSFNNGEVDVNSIKNYDAKKELVKKSDMPTNLEPKLTLKPDEKPLDATKTSILNGKYVLYNTNKQVTKDGTFNNNRLMEGKAYIYNENGILTRVVIYKNGLYVGDGIIEK
jgi:antitoxin component YwqK of YwqJK toxin-antitoxin module